MPKLPKSQVGYHEDAEGDRCAVCKYFTAPNSCAIVAGTVAPDGWCERFKRMASRWIKGATENAHGQFRAKAEKAGMTTREFAKAHEHDSGKTGAQARLAETLMGMHPKGKKESLFNKK